MKRIFIMLGILFSITTVFSQNIIKAEYFIDADPGQDNGITVPNLMAGETVNFPIIIPTTQLSSGFHFLNIRVADVNGIWSRYETRVFYLSTTATTSTTNIVGAEYFIDSDPGVGGATQVNIGSSGSVVNFPVSVSIPMQLSPGFHFLSIRVKDQEGKWSLFEQRGFYVAPNPVDAPPIVAAEYFYDTDPGIGSASPLIVSPIGDIITQTFLVPVPGSLSQGDHVLAIRVRDQQGHWSFLAKDTITVGNSATISCPGNITVTAQAGQCTAIVNGIDPTVTPSGTSYTYTLTGATIGTGTGTASGKTFNAGVTTVTYALNSSPSTNCSFTVTVNTDVIPVINLNASATDICPGQQVVFTTLPFNGGATPSYQWKLNGNNIPGATSSTYQSTSLANGDIITVVLTSSLSCASPLTATSNPVVMTTTQVTPMVTITSSTTTPCYGQAVTFTANPVNGGASPFYIWRINNISFGIGGPTFQSTLQDGDSVSVQMHSSYSCASVSDVQSSWVVMHVTPSVMQNLSINASATSICPGQTVTFTALPENASSPVYQWKLNGNNVGSNSPTYQNSTLANHDTVQLSMTSSGCVIPQTVNSNSIVMNVSGSGSPSVIINATQTSICSGQQVTFTATPTNGGNSPTYQWKLNGNNAGSNSPTYQNSTLQNGDSIRVVITSSLVSVCQPTASSNSITVSVGQAVAPSVSINASAIDICAGQQVTFTATPTNGGNSPIYQWKLNGNNVGSNSAAYQTSSLANADTIKVVMTSSLGCASTPTATSNSISMDVSTSVVPSVSMYASQTSICTGWLVKFFANPVNGGSAPIYQWKLNGNNVGTNSGIFQSTTLNDNDVVSVVMTSSLPCAGQQPVESNTVPITVGIPVMPSVSIEADNTTICSGTLVSFTAHPTNGGPTPQYKWMVNGIDVEVNSDTYQSSTLTNGDSIQVIVISSLNCAIISTAISNTIKMTVTQTITYYADKDGDGYGDAADSVVACGLRAGFVTNKSDCNDGNASIHPGAAEICGNGIDDNCNGQIDDNCTQNLPTLITRNYPAKEGDAGFITVTVDVSLDKPAISPVLIKYKTMNEDAIAGADYEFASGTLTIAAGKTSGTLQVRIIGDVLRESNERFKINFSNPVNVLLPADPNSHVMIIDDDKGKPTTNSAAMNRELVPEEAPFKIPSVARRNQIWMISQIGNYENEILIVNVQGQVINKFSNYQNQVPLSNVSTGLYFYRIRIKDSSGQYKFYSGRLLITE